MVARPIDALMHSRAEGVIMAAVVGLTAFFVLRAFRNNGRSSDSVTGGIGASGVLSRDSARRRAALLILCAGVFAWVIAYVLDFRPDYYPPGVTIGRLSAMHGIAGFGAALVRRLYHSSSTRCLSDCAPDWMFAALFSSEDWPLLDSTFRKRNT